MKHLEKHIFSVLATLAVFLVFGNSAVAGNTLIFDFQDNGQITQKYLGDHQEKPFLFDEIAIGEASQTTTQNEYLGFGCGGMVYSRQEYPRINATSTFYSSYSLKDKRELIFQYLFPFHFFW